MALNVQQGMLRIDGDTSGAVKSLNDLKVQSASVSKSVEKTGGFFQNFLENAINPTTIGLGLATGAIAFVGKALSDLSENAKKAANLWNQFGDSPEIMLSLAESIQYAVDGMIKLETASLMYNQLARTELHATYNQVEAVAKLAVELGRKFGEDADTMAKRLSEAFAKGEFEELKKYGFYLEKGRIQAEAIAHLSENANATYDEQSVKLEMSRIVLSDIEKKYKNVLITADEIAEIEAKATNERDKNSLITAKINENTAKSLMELKNLAKDVLDSAGQFVTGGGLEYEKLGRNGFRLLGIYQQINEERGKINKVIEDTYALESNAIRNNIVDLDKLTEQIEYQASVYKNKIGDLQNWSNQQLEEEERYLSGILKKREGIVAFLEKERDILQSVGIDTSFLDKLIEKIRESINDFKNAKDAVSQQRTLNELQEATKDISREIKDNAAVLNAFNKETIALGSNSKEWLQRSYDDLSKILNSNNIRIQQLQDISKLQGGLTVQQAAELDTLKNQNDAISNTIALIKEKFLALTGLNSLMPKEEKKKTGVPSSFDKEFQFAEKLFKQDFELFVQRYGVTSIQEARKALIKQFNEYEKEREKILDEMHKKSTSDMQNLLDDLKKEHQEATNLVKSDIEKDNETIIAGINKLQEEYLKKNKELNRKLQYGMLDDNEKKKVEFELLQNEKDFLEKEKEIYKQRIEALQEYTGMEVPGLEEYKKKVEDIQKKIEENSEKHSDKLLEIEMKKKEKLKKIMEDTYNDIKNIGESLFKDTASNMYDAMTMSDEAVKKSYMSRSELLRKALKEEMQNISKKAFVQSLWELAQAAGAYATGNVAGAAAHTKAAAAYAVVSGVALGASKAISAPSSAEIERRKEKSESAGKLSNSKAGVKGANSGTSITYQIYFPNGLLLGDAEAVAKVLDKTTSELRKRGKL